jgi:signal transduction histidine kinase
MRRIRLVFVVLAVLLLVPMVLLVRGALRSAAYETEARYRAIAERAGDELERELSALVQREESRPFGHYRFYYVPPNVAGGRYAVTRSPLADPDLPPYVIGYFELQPDGSIRSPRVPRDTALARERRDWDPARADDSVDELREIVMDALARRGGEGRGGLPQAPGTTRRMADEASGEAQAPDAAPPTQEALEALLALNRGAGERAQAQGASEIVNIHLSPLDDGSGFRVVARVGDREEPVAESALRIGAATGREETWFEPGEVLNDQVPRARRVYIHPTTGQLVDSKHLVLLRAAATEGEWFWQGVLIDLPAFTQWLDQSVFGESEVASRVQRDYFVAGGEEPRPLAQPAYVFVYRFARPFDSVAVRVALSPFSDLSGASWVYVLALLVLLTGSAGLYALYRMVEVTVGFAERRSNFAAAVSHELKTPLTAIRMYAEMLRDGIVSSEEKRREYAETITAESERLSRLINNVLEFSRLEQGTRDLSLVTGSLGGVVEEAARILEPHARRAGFELEVKVDEGLPAVRYDRDALLQVVFNLVDNTLKYARDARDRRVVLHCRAVEGGVRLSVRDNGPGVPTRHLSRIFEAFYRGGDELTRTSKGTGIGLALVRGLAERMGAAVSGRNPEDGGFEVALRFPAAA